MNEEEGPVAGGTDGDALPAERKRDLADGFGDEEDVGRFGEGSKEGSVASMVQREGRGEKVKEDPFQDFDGNGKGRVHARQRGGSREEGGKKGRVPCRSWEEGRKESDKRSLKSTPC